MNRLVILGAGGYAKTIADIAEQLGYQVPAMLDDKLFGFELKTFEQYLSDEVEYIVALGNNELRLSWVNKILSAGGKLATLIHPTAYVSPKTRIYPGTVILPHAVISTGTTINYACIINIGELIDHDCILERCVHLAPGAIVKGENRIPQCCKVESGKVVGRRQYPL